MNEKEKILLQDDAYVYSDKVGEPEYMLALILAPFMCIIAFIISR